MAFASGEYLEAWSRSTTLELRQKSMMLTILGSAGTEAWVSGAAKVHIPKPYFHQCLRFQPSQGRRLESGNRDCTEHGGVRPHRRSQR